MIVAARLSQSPLSLFIPIQNFIAKPTLWGLRLAVLLWCVVVGVVADIRPVGVPFGFPSAAPLLARERSYDKWIVPSSSSFCSVLEAR